MSKLVSKLNGERHKFLGFISGITKHHALVPGTLTVELIFITISKSGFISIIDTLSYIGRLLTYRSNHTACLIIKTKFCSGVSDILDHLSHDIRYFYISRSGDFTGHNYDPGFK